MACCQAVQHIQIEMESEMVRIVSTLIKQKNAELLKLTNTMWTSNHGTAQLLFIGLSFVVFLRDKFFHGLFAK